MSNAVMAAILEVVFKNWRAEGLMNDIELMDIQKILWRIGG